MAKITTPDSLYGNSRDILREAERENEILADIAGEEYESPGDIPKGKYVIEKRLLDAAQKKNELLESIAEGSGTISGANKLAIDYGTDVLSLKKGDEPIANSGVTLPAYGLSYDSSTGGLTLTKNGTAISGQTVSIPDYGSPLTASSAAGMTDTDKVYVYTGETSASLTNGHWYYYDGDSWEDGGTYNSQGIDTDTTLLVSGAPADAKATGDAVGELKTQLNHISDKSTNEFYFTDLTERDLANNVHLKFNTPSQVALTGTATSAQNKIPCLGNTAFATSTFRPNLDAGVYYVYLDRGGLGTSRVYWQYRYADTELHTIIEESITLTEEAELIVTVSGGGKTFNNTVSVMVSKTPIAGYTDYGYVTAKDETAREKINSAESEIENINEDLVDINNSIDDINTEIENIGTRSNIIDRDAFIYKKTGAIPAYYFANSSPVDYTNQEYLEEKIASVPDGKHFIFYTDVHWKQNRKNSTLLIEYARKRLGIKTVLNGGDIITKDADKYIASQAMANYANEMFSAFGDNMYTCMGDHDNNAIISSSESEGKTPEEIQQMLEDRTIPYSVINKWLTDPIKDKIHIESRESIVARLRNANIDPSLDDDFVGYMQTHYYYDDEEQRIRYIILVSAISNSNIIKDVLGLGSGGEGWTEYLWLKDTLETVPENYDVVGLIHNGINTPADGDTEHYARFIGPPIVYRMCAARKGNLNFAINPAPEAVGNATFRLAFPEAVSGITCDFTNLPHVNNVIVLSGDIHRNLAAIVYGNPTCYYPVDYTGRTITDNDILCVTTQTDCCANNTDTQSPMTNNTVTEQAIDIVTIAENNKIYFTRIGAGFDRSFDMSVT